MANEQGLSFDEFLQGLEKEVELYRALGEASARQLDLVNRGDGEAAMEALKEKGRLMDLLDGVERLLIPWKNAWADRRDSVPPEGRARAEKAIDEIEAVLQKVIETEGELQKTLVDEKKKTMGGIVQAQKNLKAGNAYLANRPKKESRFFDRKQ